MGNRDIGPNLTQAEMQQFLILWSRIVVVDLVERVANVVRCYVMDPSRHVLLVPPSLWGEKWLPMQNSLGNREHLSHAGSSHG